MLPGFDHRPARAAFSLAEMLVALAVLALAMGVVSTVFSATSKTAAQSAAFAAVDAQVRTWMLRIQEDLAGIDPTQSILVMHGRTIAASLSDAEFAARRYQRYLIGDPNNITPPNFNPETTSEGAGLNPATQYSNPRADILGFFSNTPTASKAPPIGATNPNNPDYSKMTGAKFAPKFVVYGHAANGKVIQTSAGPPEVYDYVTNATGVDHISNTLNAPDRRSRVPLVRWHLARRETIIEPPPYSATPPTFAQVTGALSGTSTGVSNANAYPRILRCQNTLNDAGDVLTLDLAAYLREFGRNPQFFSLPGGLDGLAQYSPYNATASVIPGRPQWPGNAKRLVNNLLYPSGTADPNTVFHHVATVLDSPPSNLTHNLGVHGLPACAWFQVEFLMPEDARHSVDAVDSRNNVNERNKRSDLLRWTEVQNGATYVFVPDTVDNRALVASQVNAQTRVPLTGTRLADFTLVDPGLITTGDTIENRRVRMWPYAIRVTVRVYDRLNRLQDPIVRSFVHRFD